RNIKVYYNDLPFTDPGGNTYLNSLGYYNYQSIEIIKGPGSSLYGAGTGGVLLIEALNRNEQPNAVAEYTRGSFGLQNVFASVAIGAAESRQKIGFQHQASEGYRVQSALKRNLLSWNGSFGASSKGLLKTTFLYSDLSYGTPGALTKAEFDANPRMARPAGGGFPGAEQAKATIYQKTFLAGASYTHPLSASFSNTLALYGLFTELRNPTVRNYSKSEEPHVGGRTSFTFQRNGLTLIAGGEWQQNFSSVATYKNKNGEPDTLQSLDDFPVRQASIFLQAGYEYQGWELIAGGSLNFLRTRFQRTAPLPSATQQQDINHEFAPRVSLSRKWKNWTVYSGIAKGFSPPTSAELVPSGS
ncbi:MAG: TonB-dependent receptor, partial [Chitinophagaceae bacterium]